MQLIHLYETIKIYLVEMWNDEIHRIKAEKCVCILILCRNHDSRSLQIFILYKLSVSYKDLLTLISSVSIFCLSRIIKIVCDV